MKSFNILLVIVMIVFSCKGQSVEYKRKVNEKDGVVFTSFGNQIDSSNVQNTQQMLRKYNDMIVTDTIQSKFTSIVKDVCQAKGCWMKLELPDGEEAMVRFKDYGFFMPMDIVGKEVIVNGLAFVEEMSIADQKHYAADRGSSPEVVEKITRTKRTYSFEADGVLLKR